MKEVLGWLVHQAVAFGLVYAGYVLGIDGAKNVTMFLVWLVCVPVGLIGVLSSELPKRMAKDKPLPAWRKFVSRSIALWILAVFVWHGHWIMAGGWTAWLVCSLIVWTAAEAHRKAAAA